MHIYVENTVFDVAIGLLFPWRCGGVDLKNGEENAMHLQCGEHRNSLLTQPVNIHLGVDIYMATN